MNKSRRNIRRRSSRKRTRKRGGEVNNSYVPETTFGFKRFGAPSVKNANKYDCQEIQDIVDRSRDRVKFSEKELTMIKSMLCFKQKNVAAENARKRAIESPQESTFRAFIEQVRKLYAKK